MVVKGETLGSGSEKDSICSQIPQQLRLLLLLLTKTMGEEKSEKNDFRIYREELILPTSTDIRREVLGEAAAKKIPHAPLSARIVLRRNEEDFDFSGEHCNLIISTEDSLFQRRLKLFPIVPQSNENVY